MITQFLNILLFFKGFRLSNPILRILISFPIILCISFTPGDEDKWEKLFNGRDFEGWIVSPGDSAWTVVDGTIDCDPRYSAPEKNLWTSREYRNFTLRIDWRIKDTPSLSNTFILRPDGTSQKNIKGEEIKITMPNSDSGIFLRGETAAQVNIWCNPVGSGDITGYRVLSPPELLPDFVPETMADNHIGEWNTFEITLIGNVITVVLNGQTVINKVNLPFLPDQGRIGLQHHGSFINGKYSGGVSLVQFRNIYIKELSSSTPFQKISSLSAKSFKGRGAKASYNNNVLQGNGVKDIDGNTYKTVVIGNTEWMAENLKTTKYNDGTPIQNIIGDYEWSAMSAPAYSWYNNDISNKNLYGALYNWYAVGPASNNDKNICPQGWHVPSDDEWTKFTVQLPEADGRNAGDMLKSCRQVDSYRSDSCNTREHPRWDPNKEHQGKDNFGFSALPAGARHVTGVFYGLGDGAFWWSSTNYYSTAAWAQRIYSEGGNVNHSYATKRLGFSVRCVKDQ